MPAIMKKKESKVKSVEKTTKTSASPRKQKVFKQKTPKSKLISSQLGVTAVKKPKNKNAFDPLKANRGVVFIKHIPHGFYEEQLKNYFEQFGQVTRTRVARSERSGRSKGFAFVEFRVPEVAKIAADTMDNYLMFKQVLKTAYIAPEEQKFNYFRTSVRMEKDANNVSRLVTAQTKRTAKAVAKANKVPTQKQHENHVQRALYKLKKAEQQYAAKNIELDLHLVTQNATKTAKKSPTKKQHKAAAVAAKAEKTLKKASDKNSGVKQVTSKKGAAVSEDLDSTLLKLVNETIDDDENDSLADEDFVPNLVPIQSDDSTDDASDYEGLSSASSDDVGDEDKEHPLPTLQNKRKRSTVVSTKDKKKKLSYGAETISADNEAEMVHEIVGKKSKKTASVTNKVSKTATKAAVTAAAAAQKKKSKTSTNATLSEFLNETIDEDDSDDESYCASTTTNSSASSPVKNRKLVSLSPTVSVPKTKTNRLVASGGIRKRDKKLSAKKSVANVIVEPTNRSKKMKLAATELIKTTQSSIKKVKASDLNKKKPKTR